MKKLLLGLGTISLAILPVAAMASCSTTMTKEVLDIKLLSDITTVTQETITGTRVKVTEALALPSTTPEEIKTKEDKLILILKDVFVGINSDNIGNFVVSVNDDSIILTGNSTDTIEYVFSNDTNILTATASPLPTIDLAITLAPDITQAKIDKAIVDYKASGDEETMAAALLPLFTGINASSLMKDESGKNKLLIQVVDSIEATPAKILLIAAPTYYFGATTDTILVAIPTNASA